MSGTPALPTGGISIPANTGSSPSAGGGNWLALFCILQHPQCVVSVIIRLVSVFLLLTVCLTHAFRQSLELPKKSAPVPRDATADPAEYRPASCPPAGNWKGKP